MVIKRKLLENVRKTEQFSPLNYFAVAIEPQAAHQHMTVQLLCAMVNYNTLSQHYKPDVQGSNLCKQKATNHKYDWPELKHFIYLAYLSQSSIQETDHFN